MPTQTPSFTARPLTNGLHEPTVALKFLEKEGVEEILKPLENRHRFKVFPSVQTFTGPDGTLLVEDVFQIHTDGLRPKAVERMQEILSISGIPVVVVLPENSQIWEHLVWDEGQSFWSKLAFWRWFW